jgi:hypothetical protein
VDGRSFGCSWAVELEPRQNLLRGFGTAAGKGPGHGFLAGARTEPMGRESIGATPLSEGLECGSPTALPAPVKECSSPGTEPLIKEYFFLSPLAVCTLCAVRRLYVLPHRAPALVAVVGDKQGASGALSAVLELSQPSGSGSHPWLPLGLELSPLLSAVRAKSPGSGTAVGINLDRPGVCLAR